MATAWDKLEQLLTCAICLDRFRNPKMLPCQHSFCQDPCMDGLQDYARRQIKCPECRAEHRIPFQGIQSYPTNVTLQRFLELHQSITGEEPDPVPTFMERCGVCSEKSSVTRCSHCDKKVCPECKEAHLDILKREISRICNQVRRALNRLQDALTQTERSVERLNINTVHMRDEIEEIVRRFVRDIKTQEEKLLKELESYSATESKTLTKMKEDLEIEFNNMKDNCDIAEKTLLDADKSWNDLELVECKDIFVKTLDFLRNFDADTVDYTRGMKFIPNTDLDALRRNLINFGELKLPTSDDVANSQVQRASSPLQYSGSSLSIPQQNMLMRSQSDHRLAAQFARRDSRLTDLVGPNSSRLGGLSDTEKDRGERSTSPNYGRGSRRDTDHRIGRYGTGDDRDASTTRNRFLRDSSDASSYRSGWSRPDTEDTYTGPQFKSRFMRDKGVELGFDDHDTFDMASLSSRSVRFEENAPPPPPSKVFDTESAPRGPLSGIIRIGDTAHFMERSHEVEARARVEKAREEEESRNPTPPVTRPSAVPPLQQPVTRRPPSRQVSEDEIEKQKKMNQAANAAMATAAAVATPQSYVASNQVVSSPPPPSVQPLPPSSIATPMSPAQPQAPSSGNKTPVSNTSAPLMSRRANMLRDEEERNSSSRQSSLESINPNRTLRDTDDDSLGDESSDMGLSRFNGPRRRRGSIDHEDSKDNSRSSQVSSISGASNTLGSTTTTTSGLRPVRAPLAKNVPIDEDEEKERETFRRRVVGPGPSLGQQQEGKQTSFFNRNRAALGLSDSSSLAGCDQDNSERKHADDHKTSKTQPSESESQNGDESSDDDSSDNEEDAEEQVEEEEGELEDGDEEEEEEEEEDDVEEQGEEEEEEDDLNSGGDEEENGEEEEEDLASLRSGITISTDHSRGGLSTSGGSSISTTASTSTPLSRYNGNSTSTSSSSSNNNFSRSIDNWTSPVNTTTTTTTTTTSNEPRNTTSFTVSQARDKGRERLPHSVANLLNRSAQVRRSSVELRNRIDSNENTVGPCFKSHAVDELVLTHASSGLSRTYSRSSVLSASAKKCSQTRANRERRNSFSNSFYDCNSLLYRRRSMDDSYTHCYDNSMTSSTGGYNHYSNSLYNQAELINRRRCSDSQMTFSRFDRPDDDQIRNVSSHRSMYFAPGMLALNKSRSIGNISSLSSTSINSNVFQTFPTTTNRSNDWIDPQDIHTTTTTHYNQSSSISNEKSHYARWYTHNITNRSSLANSDHITSRNFVNRRNSLYRSKSSHSIGGIDRNEDEDDAPVSTPTYRSRYAEANYGKQARYQYKTRDREKTPPPMSDDTNGTTGTSAWSSYLRNKYGSSRTSSVGSSGTGSGRTGLSKSKSSHAVYSRTISDSSDDEPAALRSFSRKASVTTTSLDRDSVNASSTTASTRGSTATTGPSATTGTSSNSSSSTNYSFSLPRNMYMQKKRMMFKVGTRGTEPGCFTWPRGIAVAPDNTIVVADSSNHRVQVFGSTGRFLFEFGSYGSGEGEFDCLAGVAVNRIGQFIVSDRYNHRVQIFDPSGRFLRAFGCEGRMDGRFSYPWGITTDSLGFIYVCDKENHRIQVFQSDGTFVGKFGSIGTKAGQLEHPHYIAVSNTNRVFVSDSNNHRIQIFDVNGRSLSTFGSEGSEEGQFKFPRGLAVDDQGYIIVGDSGNNRIQIFSPDGTFLKAFGSWGSGESEFKGLEGVAVSSTGNILVCDRENHRIQVF
ncbi:tripartite motif containing protein thin isoform X1 [Brevipalpus obovatus]|uniref:tripartite motif containing protein thin isoform X1 n=1 Tax=Brevipalpus obovatus TaxID=246614 RepID=UPI003D9F1D8E